MEILSHISSLIEDPDITGDDIYCIMNQISSGEILVQEKIDGQNFTFCLKKGTPVLMVKGYKDSSKSRTYNDLITEALRAEQKGDYRYQEVKLQYAKYLSELISFFAMPEISAMNISDDVIFECAMVTKKTCNLIPYADDQLYFLNCTQKGLIERLESYFNDYSFTTVAVTAVNSFDVDQSIIADLKQFFESMDKSIGDTILPAISQYLESKFFVSESVANSLAARVAFKNKKLASHKLFQSKENWNNFKLEEKTGKMYYWPLLDLESILSRFLIQVYENISNPLDVDYDLFEDMKGRLYDYQNLFDRGYLLGKKEHLDKFKLATDRYDSDYFITTEGIVFSFKGRTWKLTGQFTPANKINAALQYKTLKRIEDVY